MLQGSLQCSGQNFVGGGGGGGGHNEIHSVQKSFAGQVFQVVIKVPAKDTFEAQSDSALWKRPSENTGSLVPRHKQPQHTWQYFVSLI